MKINSEQSLRKNPKVLFQAQFRQCVLVMRKSLVMDNVGVDVGVGVGIDVDVGVGVDVLHLIFASLSSFPG